MNHVHRCRYTQRPVRRNYAAGNALIAVLTMIALGIMIGYSAVFGN